MGERDQAVFELFVKQRAYSWDDEGWFATLSQALDGVTAAEADWHPRGSGNSIWETLNHINYYNQRFVARLRGQSYPLVETNEETFVLRTEPTEAAWQETLLETKRIAEDIQVVLAGLAAGDADLLAHLDEREQRNLPMWMMHDAYHTGQIVLLRKQQGTWPQTR